MTIPSAVVIMMAEEMAMMSAEAVMTRKVEEGESSNAPREA